MTADQAVQIALRQGTQAIQAEASLLDARSGLWSAYSGVLPHVSADASRSGGKTRESSPSGITDDRGYNGSYGLSGSWGVLNLSSWASVSSARRGSAAAKYERAATRAQIVLDTKRQFYEVVKSMHLARVSAQALKLSRDDERRVRALYEVGSVSKSDLLKARVRTSQSELDSLVADHNVTAQRVRLATQLGLSESALGDVDSTLSTATAGADAAAIMAEARTNRPDVKAAEASYASAQWRLRSVQLSRLPSVSATGSYTPKSVSSSSYVSPIDGPQSGSGWAKGDMSGRLALSMSLFDGLATEARVASARAGEMRARETRDALLRNLDSEVRIAVLGYTEATERESLARRTLESASENLNLVQQKYNVGSATILDLIDSQVQLQRAQSDLVSAMAAIRVAEAELDQVRGRGE
ncbi:MAG: TolC family protein [Candidatus Eisenbacteria bacterium]